MTEIPGGSKPVESQPYCYRHPDRETYIACQRCGRPICPDCMRDASVGFQCPSCVDEGARSVRQPRTMGGGLVPTRVGVISFAIIALNVAAFLGQQATGGDTGALTRWGAMISTTAFDRVSGDLITGLADGAWWRILTAAFLHYGILHLLMNMYALYVFGPMLENFLGYGRFIAMYLTAAVSSSLFVYVLSPPNALTAGASGAVFGLFGCALVLLLKRGYDVRFLLVLLGINAFISLQANISWQGHLGGFVAGALLGLLFAFTPAKGRTMVQSSAIAAMWIVMAVGFVVRTSTLT